MPTSPTQRAFTFVDESVGENPSAGPVDVRASASHIAPARQGRRSDSLEKPTRPAIAAPISQSGRPCLSCNGTTEIVRVASLRRWVERCACGIDREIAKPSARQDGGTA
jgi:hypothetical protein